jgi:hypothetical protein
MILAILGSANTALGRILSTPSSLTLTNQEAQHNSNFGG